MKRNLCELKKISEVLFEYRVKHNLSQRELAQKLKLSVPTIVNLENEKYQPSRLTMGKILMQLGVEKNDE